VSGLSRFKAKNHPQQTAKRVTSPRLFGPDVDPAEEIDDRGTPQEFFDELHEEFRFTLDVAASHFNRKCSKYFTAERNGLECVWDGERVWCNPPYSNIEPWVRKAWEHTGLTVMLLPANRTEQAWWQDLVEPHRDGGGASKYALHSWALEVYESWRRWASSEQSAAFWLRPFDFPR
jgi:phage N-6-adenine-methyltransferase